jgi:hypothetical protein
VQHSFWQMFRSLLNFEPRPLLADYRMRDDRG